MRPLALNVFSAVVKAGLMLQCSHVGTRACALSALSRCSILLDPYLSMPRLLPFVVLGGLDTFDVRSLAHHATHGDCTRPHTVPALGQVAEFEPVVRILGAGAGGGDLTLPANLTTDDSEISFSTPEDGNPLPAGSFVVELSLNGGADFSGGPAGIEQVLCSSIAIDETIRIS